MYRREEDNLVSKHGTLLPNKSNFYNKPSLTRLTSSSSTLTSYTVSYTDEFVVVIVVYC